MIERAKVVLETLAGAALPGWGELAASARLLELEPGDYLFRAGEQQPYVFVVRTGLVKLVYETHDGKCWVKGFAAEDAFFASLSALRPRQGASFSTIALAPAAIERIEYAAITELALQHPSWQRAVCRGFELYGERKEKRERELLLLSAQERLRLFLEEQPELETRIPQKDLAGYIRVTPVALSRIRARLRRGCTYTGTV